MASFVKNFKTKNNEGFIPESVLKTINDSISFGMKYIYSKEDNMYVLVPSNDKFDIKLTNFKIKNIEEIVKKMGIESYTMNDLLNYSYNSQKPIVLLPNEGFKQYINGHEIKMSQLFIGEHRISDEEQGEFICTPPKMNDTLQLKIGPIHQQKLVNFNRIPNDSLFNVNYVSDEDELVQISYILNQKENTIKFNLRINTKNIKTASDYYNAITYIKGISDNGLIINDHEVSITNFDNILNISEETIDIWHKIIEIEKQLNIQFYSEDFSITKQEYKDILTIYSTLIKKEPVKEIRSINYFTYDFNDETNNTIEKLKEAKEGNLYIEHEVTYKSNLFNQEISLQGIIGFFNLFIEKIDTVVKESKHYIYMKNDENNPSFSSLMLFSNEVELDSFKNISNYASTLANATFNIGEYIQ